MNRWMADFARPGIPGLSDRSGPFNANPVLQKFSPKDQADYVQLLNRFAFADDRNKRNLGLSTFTSHINLIHSYIHRGDPADCLRGAGCGIIFGERSILVNIRQLKRLMFRSKSCMNACFQRLGYVVCRASHDIPALFHQILPGYAHMFIGKQWCVRKVTASATVFFHENVKMNFAAPDSSPSSPVPKVSEVEEKLDTSFGFDVQSLLNHPAPGFAILRMSEPSLPPFRS
jgi:hypothetical protein